MIERNLTNYKMCAGSLLSEVWRALHELCPSSGQVFTLTNKKLLLEQNPWKTVAQRDDTQAGLRPECRLGPREQFNEISSLIDGGVVYSNEPELLHQLRHGRGLGGGVVMVVVVVVVVVVVMVMTMILGHTRVVWWKPFLCLRIRTWGTFCHWRYDHPKTAQKLRMLSRSLSDCKSLLLNVMIQLTQFIRNCQLCH